MATTNKNSMLPTYQGNYKDMIGALRAGDISSPCWFWVEDRETLSFIHWEKQPDGSKLLVPHVMLWEKVNDLETKVDEVTTVVEDIKENGATIMITLGGDE